MSFCEECKTKLLVDSDGEMFCPNCGLVDSYVPTTQPGWKNFGTPEEDTTTGAPFDPQGHATSTEISFVSHASEGKEDVLWKRLRRINNENRSGDTAVDRNIRKASIQILRMKSMLDIPNGIANTAMSIYTKAAHDDYLHGRTIYGTLCAVIYAAYRVHGVPISLREFSKKADIDKTIVGGYYRSLKENGYIPKEEESNRALLLVSKIIASYGFSGDVEIFARKIYDALEVSRQTVGKSPSSIACSILYILNIFMELNITQRDIAQMCSISEISLRNNTNIFRQTLNFVFEV